MNTIDPQLLRCFVAVAEAGNFTEAGQDLGLTQSAISLRIKRLEALLDCRLFERTSRSVVITPMGEQLLGDARRIIELSESIIRRFREPAATGHLRVGFADYVIHGTLQTVLAKFRKYYPGITLEVMTGLGLELVPKFENHTLDLIIAGIDNASEDGQPLYSEPLCWCASHDFTVPDSEPLPLVSLPPPCSHRSAGIEQLDGLGRAWVQVFTGTSVAGVRDAARAGLGVAVLPASALDKNIRQLSPDDGFAPLPRTEVGALIRPNATEPARAFLKFFKEECSQGTPS